MENAHKKQKKRTIFDGGLFFGFSMTQKVSKRPKERREQKQFNKATLFTVTNHLAYVMICFYLFKLDLVLIYRLPVMVLFRL